MQPRSLPSLAVFVRLSLAFVLLAIAPASISAPAASKPNILLILADDLGYGDVACLNPGGKIRTPHLDRLAAQGMAFTDAHSSSAVCTPTRYGLLTGRYNWRSRLQSGVLGGYSPRLIEPNRLTLPLLLRQNGYATACIGKWHLGMDWPLKEGGTANDYADEWKVDYAKPIQNGPNAVGFDYFYGISASLDMPPYVFIQDDRVTAVPTVEKTWIRKGPAAAEFEAIDVLPTLTKKALDYLQRRAELPGRRQPFFLYLPLASPHTPILPTKAWQGKSGLNAYADFVMQTDDSVGQILETLDATGLAKNTLVIFTSDNGCSPQADIPELVARGHQPSYHFRGNKADIFEGGHRIPLLVRWPERVAPGSRSTQVVCLTDFMATCAEILGVQMPENAGEDSVTFVAALTGRTNGPSRDAIVHHSINGSFAIRQGIWKLALCRDSGGWSAPKPGAPEAQDLPAVQLYDLATDIGEQKNIQAQHPEIVARLTRALEQQVADGRSTPGKPQTNTGTINLRKEVKPATTKKKQKASPAPATP